MAKISKAYYLLIGFFFVYSNILFSQDQKIADSLYKIYQADTVVGVQKLDLLKNLAFHETSDLDLSLEIARELIDLARSDKNDLYLGHGFLQKGSTQRLGGDLNLALESYFKASEAAIRSGSLNVQGAINMTIADTYSEIGNSTNAELYYEKSIQILRQTDDTLTLATALINAGDEFFNSRKYDKAISNFEESGELFKQLDYLPGTAYNLGNLGMVHAEQGKDDLALSKISEAISMLEGLEDYYAIAEYLTYMSDIYLNKGDWKTALNYAERSLTLGQKYGLKKQISESNLQLSQLYESAGNFKKSNAYYKAHIVYRDSIINLENVQEMADLRTVFEVAQKQKEVDLLEKDAEILMLKEKRQKNIMYGSIVAFLLVCLLIFGLFRRYQFIKATKSLIEYEKQRSDLLLRNILPEETARELKQNGRVQARRFESVSVLFTDFKGFTNFAENLSPEKLVEIIDFYFSKFDEIMETYKLEKIKTIGDSYMSVAGLHPPKEDHAKRMILAAFDIINFVGEHKDKNTLGDIQFDIRIGINSGPVVAGVVGSKKFAYDIWGDAVNVASRMESNSEAGKINISQHTYDMIKDDFECEYRGELDIKNHGAMKMYFVTAAKEGIRLKYGRDSKLKVV